MDRSCSRAASRISANSSGLSLCLRRRRPVDFSTGVGPGVAGFCGLEYPAEGRGVASGQRGQSSQVDGPAVGPVAVVEQKTPQVAEPQMIGPGEAMDEGFDGLARSRAGLRGNGRIASVVGFMAWLAGCSVRRGRGRRCRAIAW